MFVSTKSSNITRIRCAVKNQLQNAETREALRQRKSAYNALFVYFVFLVCFLFLFCLLQYCTWLILLKFRYLNSSLNIIVYCWRYREIRRIVKSTIKKILRLEENMTWGCDVLRDEICRERAIVEGNWDDLTFAKTSGTVTREKEKNDQIWPRWWARPHLSNGSRKNWGKFRP